MTNKFAWYELITANTQLEQGDILENWCVKVPKPEEGQVIEEYYTLILMTQTCDIEEGISHLIFCPIWTQDEIASVNSTFSKKETIGNIKKGNMIGFYLINKCEIESYNKPWRIVQFHRIIELEREQVCSNKDILKPRLRLLPPYRESISQAFARYFMRVGLPIPVDIS